MSNTDIPAYGSGGEWKEYRRLVLRDLERFEKQSKGLLDELTKLHGDIVAMRTTLAHLTSSLDSQDKRNELLEKRVAANERALATIQGRAAGLGAVGGGGIVAVAELALRYLGT